MKVKISSRDSQKAMVTLFPLTITGIMMAPYSVEACPLLHLIQMTHIILAVNITDPFIQILTFLD